MIKLMQHTGDLAIELPTHWKLCQTLFRAASEGKTSIREMAVASLSDPVGTPTLERIVTSSSKVAILVDDLTRPTPIRELLPPVLEVLHKEGVPRSNVDIVIGNGTHRQLTAQEVEARVGKAVARSYRVINHDARSEDLMVMGEIPGYGAIKFNKTVMQANVKITLGSILPHVTNGFGGGPKNIMPGICDYETIKRHHLRNVLHPCSMLGVTEANPFLAEVTQIAKLARVDFAVQCLYNSVGKACEVLSGDVFAVHKLGGERATKELGIPVSEKTDITIVSAYPYIEGPQIVKPLLPAAMITKPGGTILLVTEVAEQLPHTFLANIRAFKEKARDDVEHYVLEKLRKYEPLIEGGPMDFNMALILILSVAQRFHVGVVGHQALHTAAERMGFNHFPDLETAINKGLPRYEKADVSVIPCGGYIFPVTAEPFRLFGE
jgi:nickel-dependent lactate racemase